jgi:7-carboxy-7-deazaguanine synthase
METGFEKPFVAWPDSSQRRYLFRLGVSEIFQSIQGEGINVGKPAVFLRLAYCNLKCVWCDTKFTWDWAQYDPRVEVRLLDIYEVERRIRGFQPRLLVVTGGEPLLQRHALGELLKRLKPDYFVEVETNGTIAPTTELLALVDRWNVSPKLENSGNPAGKREVAEVIRLFAGLPNSVFKFVIESEEDLPEVERLIHQYTLPRERVLLMPEGLDATTVLARSWRLIRHAKRLGVGFTTRLQIIKWGNRRGT